MDINVKDEYIKLYKECVKGKYFEVAYKALEALREVYFLGGSKSVATESPPSE